MNDLLNIRNKKTNIIHNLLKASQCYNVTLEMSNCDFFQVQKQETWLLQNVVGHL